MALLELRDVSKFFGGLAAVSDFSFEVSPGEILGLIGPNGAGKTTTFKVITGDFPLTRGAVILEDKDISGLPPHRVARLGVVRTFQMNTLFPHLTVLENVEAGRHLHSGLRIVQALFNSPSNRQKEKELACRALEVLEFMGLSDFKDEKALNLPHGHQRSLGIAVALAAQPRLLLLDEPLTGMNTAEVATMLDTIRRIRDQNATTIVVVEHNMKGVMALCERLVVMNFGKKIAEGRPEEITKNKDVIEAYLGSDADAA
jgi:branched-chain amino acid transport system ATP-binding protein